MDERIKKKKLPTPGNWDFINLESIVSLKPDLVIIWSSQEDAISSLELRGIPVYGVFLKSIDDVYKEILDFGKIMGCQDRAKDIVEYTKKNLESFKKVTNQIPENKRKKAYFMWAQGDLETSCGDSTVNDLLEYAGVKNICGHIKSEHRIIGLEKLFEWNPDMIIMWRNDRKDPVHIIKNSQWLTIKAIKTKSVYELPDVFLCDLWTLKFQYVVFLVAKWAYPDIFKKIDLDKEKEKILKYLYGKRITK